MRYFFVFIFLVASPFVLASMIKKIGHDEKPTAECLYFSIGIACICLYYLLIKFGSFSWGPMIS